MEHVLQDDPCWVLITWSAASDSMCVFKTLAGELLGVLGSCWGFADQLSACLYWCSVGVMYLRLRLMKCSEGNYNSQN